MAPIAELIEVSKAFGETVAVRDLNLAVSEGEPIVVHRS